MNIYSFGIYKQHPIPDSQRGSEGGLEPPFEKLNFCMLLFLCCSLDYYCWMYNVSTVILQIQVKHNLYIYYNFYSVVLV